MLHLNDQNSTSYLYNTQACFYLSFRYKDIIHINKLIKKSRQGLFTIKVKNTHFTSEKQDQVTTHSTINVWNSKLNTNWIYLHEKIQKKYWVRPSFLTVESKLKLHRLAGLTFSEMRFCKFTLVLKVKLRGSPWAKRKWQKYTHE